MFRALGDEYVKQQCPYESSHIIDKCRFQLHLNRCRKSHTNVKKVHCPFNSTHLLCEPELDWHASVCENRDNYEVFKYKKKSATSNSPSPVTVMPEVETSENWDDEPDVPSYDPKSYCEAAPVLRLCQNAPRLKRKTFRKAEHLRLRSMEGR